MRLWGPIKTARLCRLCTVHINKTPRYPFHLKSKEPKLNVKENDFLAYGILPFLQKRINSKFLPQDQLAKINKGGRPDYNAKPTSDQRDLLDALNSQVSVIFKGGENQTGKSYALATYAVNYALKKKPVYGMFAMSKSVDCVIVVPTPALVDKYAEYLLELIENIPEECCPVRSDTNDDKSHKVPFKAQFWGSAESPYTISSTDKLSKQAQSEMTSLVEFAKLKVKGKVKKKKDPYNPDLDPPHVLVTTLHQFFIISKEKQNLLSHTKFLAFDNCDSMLNSTDIGEESTYYGTTETEIKSKIELSIQMIQQSQMKYYTSQLKTQLRRVPKTSDVEWCRQAIQTVLMTKPVGQTFLKFDDFRVNDLDATINEEITELLYDGVEKNTADVSPEQYRYLKKLLKEKRRCFYKPIQYCFICEPHNPFKASIQNAKFENKHASALESLTYKINHMSPDDPRYEEYLKKYNLTIEQLRLSDLEQDKDLRVEFIKKCLFLLDASDFFQKSQLNLVTIGGFPKVKRQIDLSFYTSNCMIDIEKNLHDREQTLQSVVNERANASDEQLLLERGLKFYLQKKSRSSAAMKEMANFITKHYRKNNPNDKRPFLYVIPRDCDIFEVEDMENKVIHANKLIGTAINHYNMVLLGAETLLANSAFGKRKGFKKEIRNILNHEDDLIDFYIFKMLSLPENEPRSIMIGIDENSPFDLFLIGRIILFNDLKSYVTFATISKLENTFELQYGLSKKALEFLRLQGHTLKGSKTKRKWARLEEKKLNTEYKDKLLHEKGKQNVMKIKKGNEKGTSQFREWMKKLEK